MYRTGLTVLLLITLISFLVTFLASGAENRWIVAYNRLRGISEKVGREYLRLYLRSHSSETLLEELGDSLLRIT